MAQASIAKGLITGHLPAHGSKTQKLPTPLSSSLRLGSDPKFSGSGCLRSDRVFRDCRSRISHRISASVTTAEKPSKVPEIVLQPIKEITGTVKLPGSKSLSNRILLLAALSEVIFVFPSSLLFCFDQLDMALILVFLFGIWILKAFD